jgi:hypothetical protein
MERLTQSLKSFQKTFFIMLPIYLSLSTIFTHLVFAFPSSGIYSNQHIITKASVFSMVYLVNGVLTSYAAGSTNQRTNVPDVKTTGADQVSKTNVPDVKTTGADQVSKTNVPDVKTTGADQVSKTNVPDVKTTGANQVSKTNVPDVKTTGADQVSKTNVPDVKTTGADQKSDMLKNIKISDVEILAKAFGSMRHPPSSHIREFFCQSPHCGGT